MLTTPNINWYTTVFATSSEGATMSLNSNSLHQEYSWVLKHVSWLVGVNIPIASNSEFTTSHVNWHLLIIRKSVKKMIVLKWNAPYINGPKIMFLYHINLFHGFCECIRTGDGISEQFTGSKSKIMVLIKRYGCVWKCCVPHCTQWFCWSLSLWKMASYHWEY